MQITGAGTALVITAIGAVVGPLVTAYLQLRAARMHDRDKEEAIAARSVQNEKLDSVHTLVNNKSDEQTRQITELKRAVATNTPVPEQPPGEGGAPVTIDKGVVTVESPQGEKE